MEDTHVWVMKADGTARREIGAAIDNRQGPPQWSADGVRVYFTVEERGDSRLYRLPAAGGTPEVVAPPAGERGAVGRLVRREGRGRGVRDDHARRPGGAVPVRAGRGAPQAVRTQPRPARQPDRSRRSSHCRSRALTGRRRGLPHAAAEPRCHHDASLDCRHPRRAARSAGPGVQPQGAGLRLEGLGDADGELPRLHRLRTEIRGRHLKGPERQGGSGRARRRRRRAGTVSAARCGAHGHRGRQLRRPAHQLDRHADRSLQGRRFPRPGSPIS